MASIDDIISLARCYATAQSLELKTVSWRVFGDSKKLAALESGSDIQLSRYDAAIRWFSANWPEELAWPDCVHRPTIALAASAQ